jgi:hypothetical protein
LCHQRGTQPAYFDQQEAMQMNKKQHKGDRPALTQEELQAEQASNLPDREAMSLLDITADLTLDADVAAPLNAAVAANANVAAPINASVAANIETVGSTAIADADQDALINQYLEGDATALANQTSTVNQRGR